jgi:hypothetical protein
MGREKKREKERKSETGIYSSLLYCGNINPHKSTCTPQDVFGLIGPQDHSFAGIR